MQLGDFTKLAKEYINRPGYSTELLTMIGKYAGMDKEGFTVADVGAGTGKLTEELTKIGLHGFAVEPNDAMRSEGMKLEEVSKSFKWSKGTAEETGLETDSVDWVLMGSSFHWADTKLALHEFHRILKRGGVFTAVYNPRDIEGHPLFEGIEQMIRDEVPGLKRVSSGSKSNVGDIEERLLSTDCFDNLIFTETSFTVNMTKDRYMGAWRSVNDIQAQAGPERFEKIMSNIEDMISSYDTIDVPYKCRAWTVRSTKR